MATADTAPLSSSHQDTANPPIRRASGRRKAAGCEKKKIPQRGMGVEKLERLRVQDSLKRMSEMNLIPTQPPFPHISPPPHFIINGNSPGHLPLQFSKLSGGGGVEVLGHPQGFHGGGSVMMGVGCHQFQPPDLSSTTKCFSQHCNFCHKKKKVVVIGENVSLGSDRHTYGCNGDWGFLGLNIGGGGENSNVNQQIHHAIEIKNPFPPHTGTVPFGNNKGVEIVAIHHKKGSSGDVENSDANLVLMEYDFFPPNGKINEEEEEEEEEEQEKCILMEDDDRHRYTGSSMVDASNNIDLSLKLSY